MNLSACCGTSFEIYNSGYKHVLLHLYEYAAVSAWLKCKRVSSLLLFFSFVKISEVTSIKDLKLVLFTVLLNLLLFSSCVLIWMPV